MPKENYKVFSGKFTPGGTGIPEEVFFYALEAEKEKLGDNQVMEHFVSKYGNNLKGYIAASQIKLLRQFIRDRRMRSIKPVSRPIAPLGSAIDEYLLRHREAIYAKRTSREKSIAWLNKGDVHKRLDLLRSYGLDRALSRMRPARTYRTWSRASLSESVNIHTHFGGKSGLERSADGVLITLPKNWYTKIFKSELYRLVPIRNLLVDYEPTGQLTEEFGVIYSAKVIVFGNNVNAYLRLGPDDLELKTQFLCCITDSDGNSYWGYAGSKHGAVKKAREKVSAKLLKRMGVQAKDNGGSMAVSASQKPNRGFI